MKRPKHAPFLCSDAGQAIRVIWSIKWLKFATYTKEVRRAKGAAAVFRNNTHPKQSQRCSCVITGPQPKFMLKASKITVSVAIQNLIDSSFGSPDVNRGNSYMFRCGAVVVGLEHEHEHTVLHKWVRQYLYPYSSSVMVKARAWSYGQLVIEILST